MSLAAWKRALAGASGIALLVAGTASAQETAPQRPNILLITADDLGFSDLGVFGGEILTPHLDALANAGMMFTQFYAAASCSPTRAMLMTGLDNSAAGIAIHHENRPQRFNANVERLPAYEAQLGLDTATLPEVLGSLGYRTVMAGKWHMGWEDGRYPSDRGFDHSFALLQGGASHFKQANMAGNPGWDVSWLEDGVLIDPQTLPDNFYSSTYLADYVIEHIGNGEEGTPFFGWLAFTAPHWPLQAPADDIAAYAGRYNAGYEVIMAERLARQSELGLTMPFSPTEPVFVNVPAWDSLTAEERAISAREMEVYAAMVTALDREVGRVVEYLQTTGQYENTIIIFTSDNGAEGSRRGAANSNFVAGFDNSLANLGLANSFIAYGPAWAQVGSVPYHSFKLTGFDGGNHVPAFIHYPALIEPGRTDAVATAMDVFPTVLDILGAEHPGETFEGRTIQPLHGQSLLPVLTGSAGQIRPDDYVQGFQILNNASLHHGNWRLVWSGFGTGNSWHLHDMSSPDGQRRNVAADHPEILAEMLDLWSEYAARVGIATNPTTRQPINPPVAAP